MSELGRVMEAGEIEPGMYDAVFVSPHLDDVALSCPGALYDHRVAGRRVLVAVAFSHAGAASSKARRLYETRRTEELRAAARARYDVIWGHFIDAPFRDPPHRNFNEIVWGDDHSGGELVDALTTWLAEIVSVTEPGELIGPLGVGRHVDHRLVFRALRRVADKCEADVWHYEDRPYALICQAVTMRLRRLGQCVDVNFEEFWESFIGAPYARNHLLDESQRRRCRRRYAELSSGQDTGQKKTSGWSSRLIGVEDCGSIWNVVAAHDSQIEAFVGDLNTFRRQCLRRARRLAPGESYVERQWRT